MRSGIRAAALSFAAAALAACVPGGLGPAAPVTRSMAVSGGTVTIAGPAGYCIDRGASRDGPETAFVLFGTCAALAGSLAAGQPAKPAVLTVSVTPGAPGEESFAESFPSIARLVRSEPGRAALSRSGDAETVVVQEITAAGNVMYLRLQDRSATEGPPVEAEYWRAIMVEEGRIITLSALGLRDRPLSSSDKRRALEALVRAVRAANSGSGGA